MPGRLSRPFRGFGLSRPLWPSSCLRPCSKCAAWRCLCCACAAPWRPSWKASARRWWAVVDRRLFPPLPPTRLRRRPPPTPSPSTSPRRRAPPTPTRLSFRITGSRCRFSAARCAHWPPTPPRAPATSSPWPWKPPKPTPRPKRRPWWPSLGAGFGTWRGRCTNLQRVKPRAKPPTSTTRPAPPSSGRPLWGCRPRSSWSPPWTPTRTCRHSMWLASTLPLPPPPTRTPPSTPPPSSLNATRTPCPCSPACTTPCGRPWPPKTWARRGGSGFRFQTTRCRLDCWPPSTTGTRATTPLAKTCTCF